MNKFLLLITILILIIKEAGAHNCVGVPGHSYSAYSTSNSGPGSLRQAILDANQDQTGGTIYVSASQIYLSAPLPAITVDSLIISGFSVNFGGASEPLFTFSTTSSCVSNDAYFYGVNPATFTVTNTNDTGAGSLRDALLKSNCSTSNDQIVFNISGSAPHTISAASSLPEVFNPVSISGSSQPANGYTGSAPKIYLDGSSAPNYAIGFNFSGPQFNPKPVISITGINVQNFKCGIRAKRVSPIIGPGNIVINCDSGIFVEHCTYTNINGNNIGVDSTGNTAGMNFGGIELIYDTGAIVQNNVISGNEEGIQIFNDSAITILNNKIGTDITGTIAVANTSKGISIGMNSRVTINGNLISGNRNPNGDAYGIRNTSLLYYAYDIINNKIGTNLAGTDSLGNDEGIRSAGSLNISGNLISGNTKGAYVYQGNYEFSNNKIGTDYTGNSAIPNYYGIRFDPGPQDTVLIHNNQVSGNQIGIICYHDGYAVIKNNNVGLNSNYSAAVPNSSGIICHNFAGSRLIIGGPTINDANIVCGNSYSGIDAGSSGNISNTIIRNNRIGVNGANAAFGNHIGIAFGYIGAEISDNIVKNNDIGMYTGTYDSNTVVKRNIISNNFNGMELHGKHDSITNNTISDNLGSGILVHGQRNIISKNSIFDNAFKAIQLDSNNLGNALIAPPQIHNTTAAGVSGISTANANIELFYNQSGNALGQGKTFISLVTADSIGAWSYSGNITAPCSVVATQTDSSGNTSEFTDSMLYASAGPDTIICTNSSLTLYAQNTGYSGSWSNIQQLQFANPSQSNTTVTGFTAAGTYVLVWFVTNGACSAVDLLNVEAVVCSGVEEQSGNSRLQYINPVSQFAEFRLEDADEFEIKIWDSMGKQVYNSEISGASVSIDASHFANGIYSFQIFNNQKPIRGKLIVLHK